MDLIKRAIKDMAHSVDGGYASVAAALGLSSRTALENRLYQVKGQRVSIEEALAIQRISGRNDFAEAVAAESGGVLCACRTMFAARPWPKRKSARIFCPLSPMWARWWRSGAILPPTARCRSASWRICWMCSGAGWPNRLR